MRLNKYLSSRGVCSRRQADGLIAAGRVSVNGHAAAVGQSVAESDVITVDGHPVKARREEIFLAVHKPRGVVVTTDRRWGDPVLEDLVDPGERVFAVGRLDKESEGLILMTNDGDLSNRIQKAAGYHEKEYIVTVNRPVTQQFLDDMGGGVYLEELNRTTRSCRIRKIDKYRFNIILTEGMNRQIRRMCEAFGYQVRALKRIRVMNIRLGDLPPGESRALTRQEIRELKRLAGTAEGTGGNSERNRHG